MLLALIPIALPLLATTPQKIAYPDSPEAVVRALYDRVTWTPPTQPSWDAVREVFHPEAVLSLRLGPGEIKVMGLDGFIKEWVDYAKLKPVVEHGFSEKIIKLKASGIGDVSNVFVLYEAQIPGYMKTPERGVDICHLVKREGKWRIMSIVNEVVRKDMVLPEELR